MSGKNNFIEIAYVFRIFNLWMIIRFFVFHFLGLSYISKALKMWGVEFDLVDCTLIILTIEGEEESKDYRLIRHKLPFDSGLNEDNLKEAIGKAQAQFYGLKYFAETGYVVLGRTFERFTDFLFGCSSKFKTYGKIILIIFKHFRSNEKLTYKMKKTSKVQPCKN